MTIYFPSDSGNSKEFPNPSSDELVSLKPTEDIRNAITRSRSKEIKTVSKARKQAKWTPIYTGILIGIGIGTVAAGAVALVGGIALIGAMVTFPVIISEGLIGFTIGLVVFGSIACAIGSIGLPVVSIVGGVYTVKAGIDVARNQGSLFKDFLIPWGEGMAWGTLALPVAGIAAFVVVGMLIFGCSADTAIESTNYRFGRFRRGRFFGRRHYWGMTPFDYRYHSMIGASSLVVAGKTLTFLGDYLAAAKTGKDSRDEYLRKPDNIGLAMKGLDSYHKELFKGAQYGFATMKFDVKKGEKQKIPETVKPIQIQWDDDIELQDMELTEKDVERNDEDERSHEELVEFLAESATLEKSDEDKYTDAWSLVRSGDYKEARKVVQELYEKNPKKSPYTLDLAFLYMHEGNYMMAGHLLNRGINRDIPCDDPDVYIALALCVKKLNMKTDRIDSDILAKDILAYAYLRATIRLQHNRGFSDVVPMPPAMQLRFKDAEEKIGIASMLSEEEDEEE